MELASYFSGSSKSHRDGANPDPNPSSWVATCSGSLKVNCDGAFLAFLAFGYAVFIVRDFWLFCGWWCPSFPILQS